VQIDTVTFVRCGEKIGKGVMCCLHATKTMFYLHGNFYLIGYYCWKNSTIALFRDLASLLYSGELL